MMCYNEKLRVAIISKSDFTGGGASRVAEDLARMLNASGQAAADHWYRDGSSKSELWKHKLVEPPFLRASDRAIRAASRIMGIPDFLNLSSVHFYLHAAKYDIIHFHDISSIFSPIVMRWIAHSRSIAWTFHDCSPFTGGCIYPLECTAYRSRCGSCPQRREWPLRSPFFDFTGVMQSFKINTSRASLYPVVPSQWIAEEAVQYGQLSVYPRIIPNCVDINVFKPYPKENIRKELRLPLDKFIVILSANGLHDPRKGVSYALAALHKCCRPVFIMVVGHTTSGLRDQFKGLDYITTGFISDNQLLSRFYAAADILIVPSLSDNLPCVILEAMASAVPTIAFRSGGIPEMIEHRINGWLAERMDADGLAEGVQLAFDNPNVLAQWARSGLEKVNRKYSPEAFVGAHLRLYRDILERRRDTNGNDLKLASKRN